MENKNYYQNWLYELNEKILDKIGWILKLELHIYELEKLILKAEIQGVGDEPDFHVLRNNIRHWKSKHRVETFILDDLELDAEHCKFMIKRFNDLES